MSNELGKYLRARRGALSLRDFAAKCNISHTHLDSIEKGADPRSGKPVAISTETIRLIADGIGEDYIVLACLADGVNPFNVPSADLSQYRQFVAQHPEFGTSLMETDLQLFGSAPGSDRNISVEDKELWELFEKASPEKKAAIRALLK